VTDHRGDLIAALLVLARYWFLNGRPKPKKVRSLGSFETWCNVVGGILELAGVEGFLGNGFGRRPMGSFPIGTCGGVRC
jgi:hypothetical protein